MLRTRSLALLSALFLAAGAFAAEQSEPRFEEGVHYERLPHVMDTRDTDKVEVVEVFSYACIHCKNFQPAVDEWRKDAPAHVDFYRLPATFNAAWAALAQAFYTAEALGVTEQVHEPMFRAIHDKGINLTDPERMAEIFEREAGVDPQKFKQVYNSFSVRSRVQQADARGRAYRITGTPTVVVDGTWRVDGRMAGSNAGMLEVVDYLVAKRRAEADGGAAQQPSAQ